MITNSFSPESPVTCAQGRHGEIIIAQGDGVRPVRSDRGAPAIDAGMDPPATAPQITVNTPARHYIARTDVYKPGLCYYAPPVVSFPSDKGVQTPGGRQAKASSFLAQSVVSEIRVDDGGKYYIDPPSVELSATHGSGAVLEAVLSGTPGGSGGGGGDAYTGITEWKIIQAPPVTDEGGVDDGLTWYYAGGTASNLPARNSTAGFPFKFVIPNNSKWDGVASCPGPSRNGFNYTVNFSTGTGASFQLKFEQPVVSCSSTVAGPGGSRTEYFHRGARQLLSVTAVDWGKGYSDTEPVVVRIPAASGNSDRDIIIHGLTSGNPDNTTAESFGVSEIAIKDGGKNYLVAPQIKITSNSGFGAFATCKVKNGKITEIVLESGGNGYKTPPKIEVIAGGAEAFAISRPHLRGKYQCYYRYIDDTPEEKGGPIPSNLSPVLEVDAGDGAQSLWWVCPQPTGRATKLELWRTTSNQATTLYRVKTLALTGGPGTTPPTVPGNPTDPPGPNPPPPGPPPSTAVSIASQPTWKYFGTNSWDEYERCIFYTNNPSNLPVTVRWYGKNRPGTTGITADGQPSRDRWVCHSDDWTLIAALEGVPTTINDNTTLYTKSGGATEHHLYLRHIRDVSPFLSDPYVSGAYQQYRAEISFSETIGGPVTTLTTDVSVPNSMGIVWYPSKNCGGGWFN